MREETSGQNGIRVLIPEDAPHYLIDVLQLRPGLDSFLVSRILVQAKLFSNASATKIFACSTKHDTCAKPAVPRHAHPRTRPSFVFQ